MAAANTTHLPAAAQGQGKQGRGTAEVHLLGYGSASERAGATPTRQQGPGHTPKKNAAWAIGNYLGTAFQYASSKHLNI
jgi:hypothetical protein